MLRMIGSWGIRSSWKGGCRREALIWFGRLWRVERFPVRSTVSSARCVFLLNRPHRMTPAFCSNVWRAFQTPDYKSTSSNGRLTISSTQILTTHIRTEIATCSETAYPSLPISSTKNLLFLDSEGAVIEFAQARGWLIRDGRIFFPNQNLKSGVDEQGNEKELSQLAIENTLGYARELETIV